MPAPRTFVTRLGDREVPVEIQEISRGQFQVSLDGDTFTFDARRLGSKIVSVLVDARHHEVSVLRKGDDYDLLVGGRRFRVSLVPEAKARRQRGAVLGTVAGRQEIKASMPGKVVDVLVKVGDHVEALQGLLIVEAMKMENEIKAAGGGEVKEIHVKPGQAVESGELLAVVE